MLFGTQLDSCQFVDEHFHGVSLCAAIAGSKAQLAQIPEPLVNTKWPRICALTQGYHASCQTRCIWLLTRQHY